MIGDAELLTAARGGDISSLGTLLERYRPRLHAIALAELGYGPEAEDAVHDTLLTALHRLDDLRDPEAVRSWLDAVLRNTCRMYRRERRKALFLEETKQEPAAAEERFERDLDRHAMRDWIWNAIDELPEALRVTTMLRYFGSYPHYGEIAQILTVPVGTVRSRLSATRAHLARLLLSQAADAGDRARRDSRIREWEDVWRRFSEEEDREILLSRFAPNLAVFFGGKRFGFRKLADEIDGDLETGTKTVVERTMASGSTVVVEARFINPKEQPLRCPPGGTFVMFERGPRIGRAHLYNAPRPPQ